MNLQVQPQRLDNLMAFRVLQSAQQLTQLQALIKKKPKKANLELL
jgi:hypothetical protein